MRRKYAQNKHTRFTGRETSLSCILYILNGAVALGTISLKSIDLRKFVSNIYRDNIHNIAVYQKYLMIMGELIIFEPWRENYHFSQPS